MQKKGNTGRVAMARPIYFPEFELLWIKSNDLSYVFTKHYTTFFANMNITHDVFFKYLLYNSSAGGVLRYTTELLDRFKAFIALSEEHYKTGFGYNINTSIKSSRNTFEDLIEWSILIPMKEKQVYLINPCVVFHKAVAPSRWGQWNEEYIAVAKSQASAEAKARKLTEMATAYMIDFHVNYEPITNVKKRKWKARKL